MSNFVCRFNRQRRQVGSRFVALLFAEDNLGQAPVLTPNERHDNVTSKLDDNKDSTTNGPDDGKGANSNEDTGSRL
jgi:hypothetical protein